MLSPQFVNRNLVVRIQSLSLSLLTVPPLLSSILGTWFWRGPLKPLAEDGFPPRSLLTVNEAPAGLTEAHVLLFADDVLLFVSHLFPCITSSLQGPPNYSTYAGLHSNQILTVKVCAPRRLLISRRFLSGCREAKHSLTVSDAAKICSLPQFFPSLWTVLAVSFTPLHPRP